MDEIWTCRDGKKIPVGEMHEEHVRNALRMILREKRRQEMVKANLAKFFLRCRHGSERDVWPHSSQTAESQDQWPMR